MYIMPKISKVRDGIPNFVRDYLDLNDTDELQCDDGTQASVRLCRLLKRDHNVTGYVDLPTEQVTPEKTTQEKG
jgi:hypothetical protein